MAGGSEKVLNLGDSLTIAGVAELHQKMSTILETGEAITMQGNEIKQIDGAGLQLLAALIKEAVELGVEIRWGGISDSLRQGVRQLGLNEALMQED